MANGTNREGWSAPKRWSKEEVERLLELKKSGTKKQEIARQLGRSPTSVEGKLDDLSLFGMPGEIRSHSVRRSSEPDLSSDLLRERDRILATDNRTPGEVLLGSPPLHRSALFKKMGETA